MPFADPSDDTKYRKRVRAERRRNKQCIKCGKLEYKSHLCQKHYQSELIKSRPRGKRRAVHLKAWIIGVYGGKCKCCGEDHHAFLTLDHIDGNGAIHRKQIGVRSGSKFYRWVIENGFPDLLQLLCWNCNCGKRINGGTCPHQELTHVRVRAHRFSSDRKGKVNPFREQDQIDVMGCSSVRKDNVKVGCLSHGANRGLDR